MSTPMYVDEPILVQARFLANGDIQPTAFIWRDRTRYISDTGRRWVEDIEGTTWEYYLVQTATRETFEIRLDRKAGRWILRRAWLSSIGPA